MPVSYNTVYPQRHGNHRNKRDHVITYRQKPNHEYQYISWTLGSKEQHYTDTNVYPTCESKILSTCQTLVKS